MSYWAKIYGPGEAKASAVDREGNIIMVGEREGNGFIAKLDRKGSTQWFKIIESADFRDLKIAPNGDFVVVGSTHTNALVLRIDGSGNIKWQKTYGGEGKDDCIVALEIVNNDDIVLAGWTDSFGAGKRDAWVLRVDGNGNVKWQKTYGGNDDDVAFGLGIMSNGDIILGGSSSSFLPNEKDHKKLWVLRVDGNGNVKWQKTYSGLYNLEVSYSMVVVPSTDQSKEQIVIVGDSLNILPLNEMIAISMKMPELLGGTFLLKLDGHGNVRWRKITSSNSYHFNSIALDSAGNIIITGHSRDKENHDMLLLKLNSMGEVIWQRAYGGSNEDEANTISVLPSGSIFIAGSTKSFGMATKSIFALTVPPNGALPDCDFCKELNTTLRDDELQSFDTNCEVYSDHKKIQVEIEEGRFIKKKRKVWQVKYAPLKINTSTNAAKIINVQPKVLYSLEGMEESLSSVLHALIPSFTESVSTSLKLTLTNTITDSLKVKLDLSENSFIELDETEVKFPELRKGQKIAKTLTVTPKYAGKFDFKIKIKAVVNGIELEAEKVIPVEVKEKATTPPVQSHTPPVQAYTPAQFTPSPTTPKTFPPELAELYTDVEFIGKGGFARVFKAKRKSDGEIVAVKIPLSLDPVTGKSFLKEIENWTKLKHPNIVRVYDYNILPIPFFEMEYCEDSLENLLRRRGYLPPMEAAGIIFDIAEGLKYAHSLRIIHRDLKPSNILLKQGIPKISDWGLSKVLKESRSSTFVSFTPYYAAPEQISKSKFGSTNERTDIWQLGVIFYQLVTGKLPFEGEDFIEVSSSIVFENPERPSELNPDAKPLDDIIMRCLAKRKEERYESTAELQGELALLLGMEYRRNLKKSAGAGDLSRSAYYAGELLLVNLKVGDLTGAYKYAGDLAHYARGNVVEEIIALKEQIKLRLEEGLDIPPELVEKADVIVHKVKLGWRDV